MPRKNIRRLYMDVLMLMAADKEDRLKAETISGEFVAAPVPLHPLESTHDNRPHEEGNTPQKAHT